MIDSNGSAQSRSWRRQSKGEQAEYHDVKLECGHCSHTVIRFSLIQRGRQEGRQETLKEMARKMMLNGMDHQSVAEVTGLSKDEIAQLSH